MKTYPAPSPLLPNPHVLCILFLRRSHLKTHYFGFLDTIAVYGYEGVGDPPAAKQYLEHKLDIL